MPVQETHLNDVIVSKNSNRGDRLYLKIVRHHFIEVCQEIIIFLSVYVLWSVFDNWLRFLGNQLSHDSHMM